MAQSAKKFVYEIQAQYSGQQSLRQLQNDLTALGKIDIYQASIQDWQKLNAQFVEAKRKLREVRAEMRGGGTDEQRTRFANLSREVQNLGRALDAQRGRMASASRDLQQAGIAASQAAQRYGELQRAVQQQGTGIAARQTLGMRSNASIQAEINSLRQAYAALGQSGTASAAELNRAHAQMQTRIRALRAELNGVRQTAGGLKSVFAGLAVSFGALSLGKSAIREFAAFDDQMLRVKAIAGATSDEFGKLREQAQQLGASTRFTAVEAASAMAQLAAAGQTVPQIQQSIQAAMDIAAIAQMDVGVAADQLTNIMSQFGIEAKDSVRVADALASGFTGAATSMEQLSQAMSYSGSTAHALGYSIEQTTAILMGLADVGLKADRAGTTLRGGLVRLIKPPKMARDALNEYGISLKDSEGKMKNFADILDDLKSKILDTQTPTKATADLMRIFGQEAGPGMVALVTKGGDALRKYEERLNSAGGTARKTADEMESAIGGALRRLDASVSSLKQTFGEAMAPAVEQISKMMGSLSAYVSNMAGWEKTVLAWGLAFGAVAASLSVLGFTLAGIKLAFASLAPVIALVGGALNASFLAVCVASAAAVAKLVTTIYQWRQAEADVAKSRQQGVELNKRLQESYARIAQQTGIVVRNNQELTQAIKDGKLHFDGVTETWVRGAAQRVQATKELTAAEKQAAEEEKKAREAAIDAAAEKFRQYAEEVKRLQDEIAGREKSLAAELRAMGRGGMDDLSAWEDQRREAEEYMAVARQAAEAAKQAMAGGDQYTAAAKWKEAVAAADQAKQSYKALNTEVKSGDQVAISKAEALKTAMQGVQEAGQLGLDILKEQEDQAKKTMDELADQHGIEAMISKMDEAARAALNSWKDIGEAMKNVPLPGKEMADDLAEAADEVGDNFEDAFQQSERAGVKAAENVGRAFDRATKDRVVNISTREKHREGGMVLGLPGYKTGGRIPGYGGGDRVNALLERGEFVMRKESVARFGPAFFEALNSLRLPDFSALFPPQQLAGAAARTVNINLRLGDIDVPMQTDEASARKLERWYNLRSSNRVTRTNFRG